MAALAIVVLLIVLPVVLIMGLGALAAIIGSLVNNEVDARHKGSELYDVWS